MKLFFEKEVGMNRLALAPLIIRYAIALLGVFFTYSSYALTTSDCVRNGGDWACFKPVITEWKYGYFDDSLSQLTMFSAAKCRASEGEWQGINGCKNPNFVGWSEEFYPIFTKTLFDLLSNSDKCVVNESGWGQSWIGFQNTLHGPVILDGVLIRDFKFYRVNSSGECTHGGHVVADKSREYYCPKGSQYISDGDAIFCAVQPQQNTCSVGNPIYPLDGRKIQKEIDFNQAGIEFSRYYNSLPLYEPAGTLLSGVGADDYTLSGQFGLFWRSSYDIKLWFLSGSHAKYFVSFPDGLFSYYTETFQPMPGGRFAGQLSLNGGLYSLKLRNKKYVFDEGGLLREVHKENGTVLTLSYTGDDPSLPIYALNAEGAYTSNEVPYGVLASITSNKGGILTFKHARDGRALKAQLGSVEFEYRYASENKLTEILVNGTHHTEYKYISRDMRFLLSEKYDANGKLYAAWNYDSRGRATESLHAGGFEQFLLNYSEAEAVLNPSVTITNPLGKSNKIYFDVVAGGKQPIKIEGLQSVNCAAANQYKSYYPNATLQTQTDWEGNVIYFERDTLGRTIKKTEALKWPGTPQYGLNVDVSTLQTTANTKITQTCWHTTHNKPERIIEPSSVTVFEYFDNGKLKNKKVEARSEENSVCP